MTGRDGDDGKKKLKEVDYKKKYFSGSIVKRTPNMNCFHFYKKDNLMSQKGTSRVMLSQINSSQLKPTKDN
jgi:hypothetical protein